MNMKKQKILYTLTLILLFTSRISLAQNSNDLLFTQEKTPTQTLKTVLDITNIQTNNSIEEIVAKTQKEWLRPPNKERFEIETDTYANKKDLLLPLFKKLEMIDAITPIEKKYRYAIVLGALLPRIQKRISYLISLWNSGVRFDAVVFLTGQRTLDKTLEIPLLKTEGKTPETETDMVKIVYQTAIMPNEMRAVPVIFVDAKTKDNKRPTTGDTVNAWLTHNPPPGSCLVVSNQPYVHYQEEVLKTLLPETFTIECIGDEVDDNEKVMTAVYLDTLARWLYQRNLRFMVILKSITR
jgi:hypothetical protein